MIVTVTPNPALDRTLEVGRLVLGDVNRARATRLEPSGKGVNVARALALNGFPARAILPMGGADGGRLIELLEAEGVRYATVPIAGDIRVNVTLLGGDGHATKVNEIGPTLSPDEISGLEELVIDSLDSDGWVVASGSLPPGVDAEFFARLCKRVRKTGARFALDSSGEALKAGIEAAPDLVKPNLAELVGLSSHALPTHDDVVAAAFAVRQKTGGSVLVSLGAEGCLLVDESGVLSGSAKVDDVYNTTGGGDSLLAGYLAGVVASGDRVAALREAIAWAGAAVRSSGSVGKPATDADRAAVHITGRSRGPGP